MLPRAQERPFDGQHLYQIGEGRIQKIDPKTGHVLSTIPTPGDGCSGLAWAEGTLWVGLYEDRKIQQVDSETGRSFVPSNAAASSPGTNFEPTME